MGKSRRRRAADIESTINVTPMGDVSLALLLGFLVITPIILETMSATLPQGGGVAAGQVKQDPIVVLNSAGQILINGKEVTREELAAQLTEVFPAGLQGERKVLFTGSPEVPYEEVIEVLDLLKKHGVDTFGIR